MARQSNEKPRRKVGAFSLLMAENADQVKNNGTTTLEISRISAPPRREEICANGISDMRRAAESTATSPVPPMLAMHSPAVIADSMG